MDVKTLSGRFFRELTAVQSVPGTIVLTVNGDVINTRVLADEGLQFFQCCQRIA